jgi:hypothetical protein
MQLELSFDLDDKVMVKENKRTGKVKSFKVESYKIGHHKQLIILYLVQFDGNYTNEWIKEDRLIDYDPLATGDTFSNNFEVGLLDLLIDVYLLDKKNIPIIQLLHNEKNLYL